MFTFININYLIIMKKLLLLASLAFVFGSCSNDLDQVKSTNEMSVNQKGFSVNVYENDEVKNLDYESIGILHNEGLDFLYSNLVSVPNTFPNLVEFNGPGNFVRDYTLEFINTSAFANSELQYDNFLEILNEVGYTNEEYNSSTSDDYSNKLIDLTQGAFTSPAAQNMFDFVETQFQKYSESESFTVNDFEANLRPKEAELDALLDNGSITQIEYVSLRSVIVTAIYSLHYWDANYINWIAMAGEGSSYTVMSNVPLISKDTFAGVGKADVRGAIYGSIRGFLMAGPGGLISGAGGGALGGSAAKIVINIIKR